MDRKRILVIEDDGAIRRGIVDALGYAGYIATEAGRAPEGREKALRSACDLVLLDLVLSGGDGFDILRDVRTERPGLPVIILTARGEEDDRVRGLQLGADDYMVKPFSVKELLARVEAVLRRSPERPKRVAKVAIPKGTVDLGRSEIRFDDGARTELSQIEASLFEYLAGNCGRVISRDELLQRVWQMDPRGLATRTIDMHVARLREKLRDNPLNPGVIRTVRGRGYMFSAGGGPS